jgi:hypothetical protein
LLSRNQPEFGDHARIGFNALNLTALLVYDSGLMHEDLIG